MNIAEIKVGETYNVRVRVNLISNGIISAETVLSNDEKLGIQCGEVYDICIDEADAFSPLTEQPTYNPCRRFKKGDRVRVVNYKGRSFCMGIEAGTLATVAYNEKESTNVDIEISEERCHAVVAINPAYLELVTPVEELEPYTVDECGFATTLYVRKNDKVYLSIPYKEGASLFQTREEALAAAEAECDRLNAEYRKEQNNEPS